MGRLTEGLDYINRPHKPAGDELARYKRIIPEDLEGVRKRFQERIKKARAATTQQATLGFLTDRNLTPDAFRLLLGRRYNRMKKAHGGDRKSSGQFAHLNERSAETLAEQHGVNEKTIRRAGKFAQEVESTPELAEAVATRKPIFTRFARKWQICRIRANPLR